MAKVEYKDVADDTFRVAQGQDGALNVRTTGAGAVADDGTTLDLGGAMVLNYNGDDTLNYIEVASGSDTYRQTFSYTGGNLTGVSAWTQV